VTLKIVIRALRRTLPIALISTVAFCSAPSSAAAAYPCHSVRVGPESTTARVASVRVSCSLAREIVIEVYGDVEVRGIQAGTPKFHAKGFDCEAVLAETELSCQRGHQWIFASTQTTDHPNQWNPPPAPPRECGGIAKAEGFVILAETPKTSCHFARSAAKKVRYVVFRNGGNGVPDRFRIRVFGRSMTCRNTYRGRIERIVCRGPQREMVMEYTSP
jgi:hypothetical protein